MIRVVSVRRKLNIEQSAPRHKTMMTNIPLQRNALLSNVIGWHTLFSGKIIYMG
jgi:hypothetical protein